MVKGISLLAILVVGAALRFAGIEHLLPAFNEPDAVYVVQARHLQGRVDEPAELICINDYPAPVSLTMDLAVGGADFADPDASLEEHLASASREALVARWIIAVLALLAIPATWFLASAFLPAQGALLASLLVAVSLALIQFSQQGRPHAAQAALAAVGLCAALNMRRQPTWRAYLFAGLAGAAAFAVLHTGLFLLPAFLGAHFARERSGPSRGRADLRLGLILVLYLLVLGLFYGNLFQAPGEQGQGLWVAGSEVRFGVHRIDLGLMNGAGALRMLRGLWSRDPVLLALAAAGAAHLLWTRRARLRQASPGRRDLFVLLCFALPYALVFGVYQRSFARIALVFVPLLAIPAAHTLTSLARAAARLGRPVGLAAGAALVLLAAAGGVKLAWLHAQPDSIDLATEWVRAHVEPEAQRVWLQPGMDLPLMHTAAAIDWNDLEAPNEFRYLWTHYLEEQRPSMNGEPRFDLRRLPWFQAAQRERLLGDTNRALDELQGDLILTAALSPGPIPDHTRQLRRALDERGELLGRFAPVDGETDAVPITYWHPVSADRSLWWRVLAARRLGPAVEIHRVRERGPLGG